LRGDNEVRFENQAQQGYLAYGLVLNMKQNVIPLAAVTMLA
jgi:hypothetical protein